MIPIFNTPSYILTFDKNFESVYRATTQVFYSGRIPRSGMTSSGLLVSKIGGTMESSVVLEVDRKATIVYSLRWYWVGSLLVIVKSYKIEVVGICMSVEASRSEYKTLQQME